MSEDVKFVYPCEHCGADLAGPNGTQREIGYSAHDRIQFWICPDCSGTWARFAPQHPYFALAERLRSEYDTAHAVAS